MSTLLRQSISRALIVGALAVSGMAAAQSPLGPGITPQPLPPSREDTSGLTADIFYRVILGDVALQRGETSLAARAYFEAAREARDARLARRASEVALAARMRGLAQESAKLWASLDPAAERPKQILAALAAGTSGKQGGDTGYDADVKARLEKALADAQPTERAEMFLSLNRLAGDAFDKRQVYELVRDVAKPYGNTPEAHFAVALAAYNSGAPDNVALEETDAALGLKPDWERAALLRSEIVARKSPEDAIKLLVSFTAANPDARGATGALAQLYVEQKRYAEARALFQKLWDADRNAPFQHSGIRSLEFT